MNISKRFQVRLVVIVPLIFFGITILTANLTYFLTLHYALNPMPVHYTSFIDSAHMLQLRLWILLLAGFSSLCGFAMVYAITHPMRKLLHRAQAIDCYYHFSPPAEGDEIDAFYSVFEDVLILLKSHLKEREMRIAGPLLSRVKRTDQLAVLGFLSSRIAHEIRNPLGCIKGFAQLMKKGMNEGDTRKMYLESILQSIEGMNLMVEELIEFSQPCTDISEYRDINQILREAVSAVQKEFRHKGIDLRQELQEGLPPVKTNPQKIQKAFLNILRNICRFAGDGEMIRVSTSDQVPGLVSISLSSKTAFFPPEDISRIFVPFALIHQERIGLGLCIAQLIIAAHGGDIRVESEKDFGTTFMVELPAAEDAVSACQRDGRHPKERFADE